MSLWVTALLSTFNLMTSFLLCFHYVTLVLVKAKVNSHFRVCTIRPLRICFSRWSYRRQGLLAIWTTQTILRYWTQIKQETFSTICTEFCFQRIHFFLKNPLGTLCSIPGLTDEPQSQCSLEKAEYVVLCLISQPARQNVIIWMTADTRR